MTDPSREAREAYDAWHARLEADVGAEAPWHRLARKHLPPLEGKRLLEIACGRGGFALRLAAESPGARIVAADFSATAVARAAALAARGGRRGISFEIADVLALPHPDGAFDVLVSCETIEHVRDPLAALREFARVLRPGGLLVLTTPNHLGPMGLHRLWRSSTGRPFREAGQPFDRTMLLPRTRAWVREAGLRVRAVDGIGHYLPFPGRPPVALPALDRASRVLRPFALHSLVVATKD